MNEFSMRFLRARAKTSGPPVYLNHLPPEILARILEFATDTADHTLDLCTVCKIWHGVMLSHPIFWTSLHVSVRGLTRATDRNTTISAKLVAHLERWFKRGGDLPLEVSIDFGEGRLFEPTEPFHQYLVRNPRWRAFRFEGIVFTSLRGLLEAAKEASQSSPCWPILQHFVLENSRVNMWTASGYPASPSGGMASPVESLDRIAPKLKEYTLTSDIVQYPWLYTIFHPFTNITSFETEGLGIASSTATCFVTFLLSNAINLRRLRIRYLQPWRVVGLQGTGSPANWTACVVSHPHLEELSIEELANSIENGFSLFTQYLRLPRLRVLDLSISRTAHLPRTLRWRPLSSILTPFIQNSNCEITHLSLSRFATSNEDLLQVLAQIGPTLKTLQLRSMIHIPTTDNSYQFLSDKWKTTFVKFLRDTRRAGQSILPDLETFIFE